MYRSISERGKQPASATPRAIAFFRYCSFSAFRTRGEKLFRAREDPSPNLSPRTERGVRECDCRTPHRRLRLREANAVDISRSTLREAVSGCNHLKNVVFRFTLHWRSVIRSLPGSVVVITGASAGIGRALAIQLSEAGCKLVLAARRVDRLNLLNATLGGKHLIVQTDVAVRSECEKLIATATAQFNRIDVLVCNAGYGITRRVADTSAEEMRQLFQTNVFGTTDCIRAAVPTMSAQSPREGLRGQIMIVSSAAARRGLPYFGAYSATKAAQLSLAEALRVELKPRQIAVSSVHPVGTETEFFDVAATNVKVPPPKAGEVRQSAEKVASKIVAAMRKPRPEVWPFSPARLALSVATYFPGLGDRIMNRYRGDLDAQQADLSK